ncbi:YaiO family outer membrane beta-barrel protein [bacterium]|nr:YaiO family outer membrane beta-barrel protein [bacterium]
MVNGRSKKLSLLSLLIFTLIFWNGTLFSTSPSTYIQQKEGIKDRYERAQNLAFQGSHQKAKEICQEILERHPFYHQARVLLGRLYAWNQNFKSAREELNRVLDASPRHMGALLALIDVQYWSNHLQEALNSCNLALQIQPENTEIYLKKAYIFIKMNQYKQANEQLKKVLKSHPSHGEALQLQEKIQYLTRNYKIALRYRGDSFKRGKNDYGPWHLMILELTKYLAIGPILSRFQYAHRNFGNHLQKGPQFELVAYPRFSSGTYAYLNAGYSFSTLFPKYRLGGELYKSLPWGLEISGGIRYLDFSKPKIIVYTGTLGKYHKNNLFSFRPFITSKPSGISLTGLFSFRHYWKGSDNYWQLLLGYGASPVDLIYLENIKRFNSYKIGLEVQTQLSRTLLARVHLRYEGEELKTDEWGNRIILILGLQKLFF